MKNIKKIFLELLNEFDKNCVGANITKKLFGKVSDCPLVKNPESFAISFNVDEYFNAVFKAIKSVLVSKFNEKTFIAISFKIGTNLTYIYIMAVLCRKIILAESAYVIHTKNPSTNDKNEIFAEVGIEEALVGAYEG